MAGRAPGRRAAEREREREAERTLLIFDFDDTLFPTSWYKPRERMVPASPALRATLASTLDAVTEMLVSVLGRPGVEACVVTNASAAWLDAVMEALAQLGMAAEYVRLLRGLPRFSARDEGVRRNVVDYRLWKRLMMSEVMRARPEIGHVISVGDMVDDIISARDAARRVRVGVPTTGVHYRFEAQPQPQHLSCFSRTARHLLPIIGERAESVPADMGVMYTLDRALCRA